MENGGTAMQKAVRALAILLWALLIPASVHGQGTVQAGIAGVITDSQGGVLPGVTVEVASPALIEKVRTAVSDGTGRYRAGDLPPGAYTVTFTLTGFATVRQEGVILAGAFTATVNAQMRVGALEETITVTGESPTVDVQSARRQQVLSGELITSIPTARQFQNLAVLVPGMIVSGAQDVGGIGASAVRTFGSHGGENIEGRLMVDGLSLGSSSGGTAFSAPNIGAAQEVVITTSGNLGESEVGGPIMNVVPRSGGNVFSGYYYATGANNAMADDNTKELVEAGVLRAPNELIKIWDLDGGIGGPIRRDRLWFFLNARHRGDHTYVTGMYYNKNAGDPTKWTYEADPEHRAIRDATWKNATLRLTWQATQRNKFSLFWDEQSMCIMACVGEQPGGTPTVSPEASETQQVTHRQPVKQVTFTSTVTNKLLIEAAYGDVGFNYGKERPNNNRDLIGVVEQGGAIPGLSYRAAVWSFRQAFTPRWRGSFTYVTGTHNMKVGYEGDYQFQDRTLYGNNHRLQYRFRDGIPNQITEYVWNFSQYNRVGFHAVHAQDQWTRGRLTLQGGLRYDRAFSWFNENQVGPDRFLPEAYVIPRTVGVKGISEISPRMGAAYDLRGDGRTSLKFNLGRFLEPAHIRGRYLETNPARYIGGGGEPPSTTRSWTDSNRNYTVDCDLLNPGAQNLSTTGGDICGALANLNFAQPLAPSLTYDDRLLSGWGTRPMNWTWGASVQHEVIPRLAVEVGYNRRDFGNFELTNNIRVQNSDFDPYSITAPVDPRLPDGGGYVISDLYDVSPAKFGQTQNLVSFAKDYGDQTRYWHGVDVSINARLRNGLTAQGGTSTGRLVTDNCDVLIDNPSRRNCHVAEPFLTQVKGLASYTIPKIDLQVSGTVQSIPGSVLNANYVVSSAVVAQTLGRPLSGGAANVTINLLNPGQMYNQRINEVDFRVAKVLRYGRTRTTVGLDLFNAFNADTVLGVNQTYGPAWLTPTSIIQARFAKISAQVDF
jgi:hypothetical protein